MNATSGATGTGAVHQPDGAPGADDARGSVQVLPGPGVVARTGDCVLWAEATDLSTGGLLAQLLAELAAAAAGSRPPDAVAAAVLDLLGSPRGGSLPALALTIGPGPDLLAVVAGWGRVVTRSGVLAEAGRVHRVPDGWPAAVGRADLAVLTRVDSVLDLGAGVVPGGAAVLPRPPARAAAATVDRPATVIRLADRERPDPNALGDTEAPPQPRPDGLGEVIPLRGPRARPVSPRHPLPVAHPVAHPVAAAAGAVEVRGVRCSRQHFNNPIALYCRVCGISMLQQTHIQVLGSRPPLGVLVCDDGATFSLDTDYVVGTDPADDPAVVEGKARPLRIGDSTGGVEPAHVIVSCEGWDVVLVNRARRAPAAVWHRGAPNWLQLGQGGRATLMPGSHVAFGNRRLVFESNTRAQ